MSLQQESEAFWTAPRANPGAWLEHYRVSAKEPWRDELLAALRPYSPFESVLEVGCHCGPNLQRMRAEFPACPWTGLDINGEALGYGLHVAKRERYGADTQWVYGSILDRVNWPDASFDLVLASSVLSVISPDCIRMALAEMRRLTSRLIVLQEPNEDSHSGHFHQWAHDYRTALPIVGWTEPSPGILVGVVGS